MAFLRDAIRWLTLSDLWQSSWRDARSNIGTLERLLDTVFESRNRESPAADAATKPDAAQLRRWRKNAVLSFYLWVGGGIVGLAYLSIAVLYGEAFGTLARINAFLFGAFAMIVGFPRGYRAAKDIDAIDERLRAEAKKGEET